MRSLIWIPVDSRISKTENQEKNMMIKRSHKTEKYDAISFKEYTLLVIIYVKNTFTRFFTLLSKIKYSRTQYMKYYLVLYLACRSQGIGDEPRPSYLAFLKEATVIPAEVCKCL